MKKNLLELGENLHELKKNYDYDDIEYKGIRDVRNLFDLSIKEDYYKLIRTRSVFNGNSVEYESIGDKKKILTIKEYLDVIKPHLGDLINDYKTQDECKFS